jgi:hypothetical protein
MGAGRRTVRAILAAAARCEEESLQHHADTPVRLPIALWIPPARLFYETAMENIRVHVRRNVGSSSNSQYLELYELSIRSLLVIRRDSIAKLPRNFLTLHR